MTVGSPPSSTAMHELVVPRSIPIVFAIPVHCLLVRKSKPRYSRSQVGHTAYCAFGPTDLHRHVSTTPAPHGPVDKADYYCFKLIKMRYSPFMLWRHPAVAAVFTAAFLLVCASPALAAGPPPPQGFNNGVHGQGHGKDPCDKP